MCCLKGLFLCVFLVELCYGEFLIPKVTFEAFKPAGFRASIPADEGIEQFNFHGKVNNEISAIEPGDFAEEITRPKNGYYTYYNPNLKLTPGDVVHYWMFIQHKQLGYRQDAQKWTVEELRLEPGSGCDTSVSKVSDRTLVCSRAVIMEDRFSSIDEKAWTVEQYVPKEPDYEFVIYKKDADAVDVVENKLRIKPKVIENDDILRKDLDISDGCTKPSPDYCVNRVFRIQNPVISGRIVSKLSFSYGEFEVKARLPTGNWIFPEIYLEDDSYHRIYIAYSRGNQELKGQDGSDIGGTLLFGGPVMKNDEPTRSSKLASRRSTDGPFGKYFHVYKLRWTPKEMLLYVDGVQYGQINIESLQKSVFTGPTVKKFRVVLGVGVGGINDFPNNFISGTHLKPWTNKQAFQVKDFYTKKNEWLSTWDPNGCQLQVEYVKVTAI